MSSSKNLEYKKTAFLSKSNSTFIEDMYMKFVNNDPSLPDSWKKYFYEIGDEADVIVNEINGPSWGPSKKVFVKKFQQNENKKQRLENPKEEEKIVHPYQLTGNMILIAAISGILGAKIFHNLENIDDFLADPIGQLFAFSGLTFYGGLISGALAVIVYARKHKIEIKHLIDSFSPALILAYGIGRIGCHMSGDGDWGIENLKSKPEWLSIFPDWIWSYNYPNNVLTYNKYQESVLNGKMTEISDCAGTFFDPYCYQLTNPVFPTPIYEFIMSLLIFAFLWKIRKKINIPGCLFFIYLIFNGLERFFIEKIRVNNEYSFLGGVTQAEIISVILITLGIAGIFFVYFNNKSKNINENSQYE